MGTTTSHLKLYLSSKIAASDLMSSAHTDGVPSWNTLYNAFSKDLFTYTKQQSSSQAL